MNYNSLPNEGDSVSRDVLNKVGRIIGTINLSLKDLILNWDLFKELDLSHYFSSGGLDRYKVSYIKFKQFMANHSNLTPLLVAMPSFESFINEVMEHTSIEAQRQSIKQFTDEILKISFEKFTRDGVSLNLSNEIYKAIFSYSSLEEFLNKLNDSPIEELKGEIKSLPTDYLFNMSIPFYLLYDWKVLKFLNAFGLKNVVDFNNECGNFFTKNNCKMLKLMYDMYMHYADNELDPKKNIYTDEDGVYFYGNCSRDQFYQAIKKMIVYGPSNHDFSDKIPNYGTITGEFRLRNPELFISDDAPYMLQNAFYTKSITPELLAFHEDYIPYLEGKDISSYFKVTPVKIDGSIGSGTSGSFYNFIFNNFKFNDAMEFITEYGGIISIALAGEEKSYFSIHDSLDDIKDKLMSMFKQKLIRHNLKYPKNISKRIKNSNPSLFLSVDAPKELQDEFYNRTLDAKTILSNPTYIDYLKDVDIELLCAYLPVRILNEDSKLTTVNLINIMRQIFNSKDCINTIFLYGKYIERIFDKHKPVNFRFSKNMSKDDFLDLLDSCIYSEIINNGLEYDDEISSHFKKNYPTLFLGDNVPVDIRTKFYKRRFNIQDFNSNSELLDIFGNTNIICGFPKYLSRMIPLFEEMENAKLANLNRLKILSEYYKIEDRDLLNLFHNYILEFKNKLNIDKIEDIICVLQRLSLSNSSEMFVFKTQLGYHLLRTDNPIESLDKVEKIFIENNLPTVGKLFSVFEILHPNFEGFNLESYTISPMLKKASTMRRKTMVFADLIKCAFGSNNKSVNSYLNNIEIGSSLFDSIRTNKIQYDNLSEEEKRVLLIFSKYLVTLYNNTMKGKNDSEIFVSTGDIIKDIIIIATKLSPDRTLEYNLGDRIVRMFCGFAGVNSLEQAKYYIRRKIQTADIRNRNASHSNMILEVGDFIKGIGEIQYLRNILQNGSVSREYLGSSSDSDSTPLDTDISMITSQSNTVRENIINTDANRYGPIYIVLKNNNRFITTRTNKETIDAKIDLSKMEVFHTGILGVGHYGIRTGFASSEIDYIVIDVYDPRVGLEIAMNGFYIPVVNKDGKILFTPKDYDELRAKMSGLSYYGENEYKFSENLVTEETEYFASQVKQNSLEVSSKREKINKIIIKSLEEMNLHLKTFIDGDLTDGFVELVDTGSTGRGTNKSGDGDFDFIMRLDRAILSNPSKLNELKTVLLRNFGKENSSGVIGSGDFRLKNVRIEEGVYVDIDISFTQKTDNLSYSTDMAIQDRLSTILKNDPQKYEYVIANILLAKQILKEAEVYKPDRGETPQGGLGGIGIENWILQNGGSFIDAARGFVAAAEGKSFAEFQSSYQIWDFGDNHLAEKQRRYPHDNFITSSMSEPGYKKMVSVLKNYLNTMEIHQI